MKHRHPPRLALALLERLMPDSEPLAGDLVEAFHAHPSAAWFWRQVLAAIAANWRASGAEIRPLQLVELQPADAVERTRRFSLRFPDVRLTASPLPGVSGLALVIFGGIMTLSRPTAWWLLLASAAAGCALGGVMILVREIETAKWAGFSRV